MHCIHVKYSLNYTNWAIYY